MGMGMAQVQNRRGGASILTISYHEFLLEDSATRFHHDFDDFTQYSNFDWHDLILLHSQYLHTRKKARHSRGNPLGFIFNIASLLIVSILELLF